MHADGQSCSRDHPALSRRLILAYTIEVHTGKVKHHSFLDYVFCVTFFPHLVAGPIVNYSELIPQLRRANAFGERGCQNGMLEHAMNAHQYASTISDQRAAHMICIMAHGLTSMMQLV